MVVNERRGHIFGEEEIVNLNPNAASLGDVSIRSGGGKNATGSLFG